MKPTSSSSLYRPIDTSRPISIGGRCIVPVETASYKTINFRANPDAILYSTGLTVCPVVLIKSPNPETGKYDNVVTMAHFWPNNAFDEATARGNLDKVIFDYREKGGILNERTSFQLLAGGVLPEEEIRDSARGILSDVLTEITNVGGYKFTQHESSIVRSTDQSNAIFVDASGTQITKRTRDRSEVELLTNSNPSMPLELLSKIIYSMPRSYEYSADRRVNKIVDISATKNGMNIENMDDVMSRFALTSLSSANSKKLS